MTVAFIDEVGMSAIFGELVACAVVLPDGFLDSRVRDSKQLKHKDVYALASELKEKVTFSLGIVSSSELNIMKNIFRADKLAMMRAVQGLPEKPTVLFIDGKIKLELDIDCVSIVRGDEKILGIALASIIAKDYRDHFIMDTYGEEYNKYDVASNKGYRSPKHLVAVRKHGVTEHHRCWMPQVQRVLNGSYDPIIFKKYKSYWENA